VEVDVEEMEVIEETTGPTGQVCWHVRGNEVKLPKSQKKYCIASSQE
jgi:hypothetical protein